MKAQVERVQGYLVMFLLWVLERIPSAVLLVIISLALRLFYLFSRRYRQVADTNLAIVFPDLSEAERRKIRSRSCQSMARSIVDIIRAPKLDYEWMRAHVSFPLSEQLRIYTQPATQRPIIFVSGHLGSFELLSHITARFVTPFGVIAREIKHPVIDRWWTKRRESTGNNIISRRGGLKSIVRQLRSGRSVGILFDQNVTRNNAVFVPWFGLEAATTAALGFMITQVNPVVVMFAMRYQRKGRYFVDGSVVDFTSILEDQITDRNDKILKITAKLVLEFEKLLLKDPASWFWLHRRWKTRPEGEPENIYTKKVTI